MARTVLDDVGKQLVELLQTDGRRSYAALAQEVGLSEAATRQRVQRLIESGVMQVVAVTDPLQMGFERQAMIGLTVTGDVRRVAAHLAEMDELTYVVITTGRFDVLAEVVVESDEALLEMIGGRVNAIEGVSGSETFVYLKLQKQTYAWGVR